MNPKPRTFSLIVMDVGLFLSYEQTAALFRSVTPNTVPLKQIKDFWQAISAEIIKLNDVKWFSCLQKKRTPTPFSTLLADEKCPPTLMRRDDGSHFEMKPSPGAMNNE